MPRFPVSADPQPSRKPAPPRRTSAKIWFFRFFTALVIPALFFLMLEGGLRLAGSGRPTGFFIPDDKPGYLRTNPSYVSLFLPGSFDLRQLNYRIAAKKPAGTVRIVVLGESAVQGIPVPAFGFVPQLRALLRARYPDKAIEVINTGVVAINSHVVYQIAREVARYEPDLFVVYLGNNEVVGPYGPGCTYLSDMKPLWVIRLSVWVRSTRTGQLVAATMEKLASLKNPPQEWGGMAMFVNNAVRGDDPRLDAVCHNFEANLRDIVRVATGAGARTLVCTVVSNLKDCPPFLSVHRPDLNEADRAVWQRAFDQGKLAWKLDENEAAHGHLEEAQRIDPQYADTAFMLGSLELRAGRTAEARKQFLAAQHWDALRFRPNPRLNETARAVARENPEVTLVDAALELGSDPAAPGGIPGRELLFEHVHPDWEGNYRIARLMAEGVERSLFAGQPGRGAWLDSPATAAATGYTAAERFAVLQRIALITRLPPFSNQLTYAEDQARMARETIRHEGIRRQPETLRQALDAVRKSTVQDPENPDLAKIELQLTDDTGDTAGALERVRQTRQLQPAHFVLATDEAIKLARLDRFDEAEQLLMATYPACAPREQAMMTPALADFYTRTKRYTEGRRWFDQALVRDPSSRPLRFYRGRLALNAGDPVAAETDFRAVLAADATNEAALEDLVALLRAQGKTKDAEEISLGHTAAQPDNQANHFRAAQILETRGQSAEAAQALIAAAHSGPVPVAVKLRLANLLYGQQRRQEALDQLADAWRLSRDEGDAEITASIRLLIGRIQAEK